MCASLTPFGGEPQGVTIQKLPSPLILPSPQNNQKYGFFSGKNTYFKKNMGDGTPQGDGKYPIVTPPGAPQNEETAFKDTCIIKKWIDEGLIKDRYKCYLTDVLCFCDTSIGCYWRR